MAAGPFEFVAALVDWGYQYRGWLVIGVFVVGSVVEYYDRTQARRLLVAAWVALAGFWITMVPYFVLEQKSIIEGLGVIIGVPLSLAVGYHLAKGRDSLFVLSRVVAIAGLIYQPVVTLEFIRRPLIEVVTQQTAWLMQLIGFVPEVVDGLFVDGLRIAEKQYPYESTFVFRGTGTPITYTIAIACTGLGSMAIFAGLIGAVSAPPWRKVRALAVSLPVIYALNLIRNVFISVGFGEQLFQVFPDAVMSVFALEHEVMVSYIVADRILAQSLSVVALIVITWLVVRELPEILVIVEDGMFVLTGREYDLVTALGVEDVASEA